MYPNDERMAPGAPDSRVVQRKKGRTERRAPSISCPASRRSEGDDAFDHDAFELAAVADVARGEVLIALPDELHLREHVGRHEPAAAHLGALDRDVGGDPLQLAGDRVVAPA